MFWPAIVHEPQAESQRWLARCPHCYVQIRGRCREHSRGKPRKTAESDPIDTKNASDEAVIARAGDSSHARSNRALGLDRKARGNHGLDGGNGSTRIDPWIPSGPIRVDPFPPFDPWFPLSLQSNLSSRDLISLVLSRSPLHGPPYRWHSGCRSGRNRRISAVFRGDAPCISHGFVRNNEGNAPANVAIRFAAN